MIINNNKIKLIYWKESVLNFGDLLSPFIIEKLSGKRVVQTDAYRGMRQTIKTIIESLIFFRFYKLKTIGFPHETTLLGVGSIISFGNRQSIIWGSGFMNESERFHGGKVYAVRGIETNNKLKKEGFKGCDVFGDPALLLPLLVKGSTEKKYEIGIIPHWTETDYFISKYGSQYKIIDLRTAEIEKVISEITSCKYILSTSLHGIIVAHTYNIPALWIKKGYIHTDGFKFKDYFSSVNISYYNGYENIDFLLSDGNKWKDYFEQNKNRSLPQTDLNDIRRKLLEVAPFPLISKYDKL